MVASKISPDRPSVITVWKNVWPTGTGTVVYRGRSTAGAGTVAVKVFSPDLTEAPEAKARLINAGRNVGSLQHPNIAQMHATGEQDGTCFVVTELCSNGSLADLLDEDELAPLVVASLVLDAARGLKAAAEKRVFHLALGPGNILISSDGEGCVGDFITSAQIRDDGGRYASPEERGGRAPDVFSNQYSLGAVAYHALTGVVPDALALQPIADVNPSVPSGLALCLMRMLSRQRADRYEDWDAAIEGLQSAIAKGENATVAVRPEKDAPVTAMPAGGVTRRARKDRATDERANAPRKTNYVPYLILACVLFVLALMTPVIMDAVLKDPRLR